MAQTGPVVLVSGGVGLTPMLSMLEAIAASDAPSRFPTWFVHGARNGRLHAMGARVRELAARSNGIRVRTFYSDPQPADRLGEQYDEAGQITAGWLAGHTPLAEATYFLCGPKPLLRSLVAGLTAGDVPAERIRYEFFGPADELPAIPGRNLSGMPRAAALQERSPVHTSGTPA